jgi:hypothetical protein
VRTLEPLPRDVPTTTVYAPVTLTVLRFVPDGIESVYAVEAVVAMADIIDVVVPPIVTDTEAFPDVPPVLMPAAATTESVIVELVVTDGNPDQEAEPLAPVSWNVGPAVVYVNQLGRQQRTL